MKKIAYILLILTASTAILYFKNIERSNSSFNLIEGTEYNFELLDNNSTIELLIQVSLHTGSIEELEEYISLRFNSKEINLDNINIEMSGSSHHKSYVMLFDKSKNKNMIEIEITDNSGKAHYVRLDIWNIWNFLKG